MRLLKIYQTVRHLTWSQIIHQIYYRIFPLSLARFYYDIIDIDIPRLRSVEASVVFPYMSKSELLSNLTFRFLNRTHNFEIEVDWNYSAYGKLWCYHLNYFQYLNQEDMDLETGLRWMRSFSKEIWQRAEGMEPYPISLRSMQWIKFMMRHQRYPTDVLRSLYLQYQVLLRRLEVHLLGNHILENGFSLLFGALFFQDSKLRCKAERILTVELSKQYLQDGAHAELSPMYHVILLERLLDCYNILGGTDSEFDELKVLFETVIQKALNWLISIRFSNGDLPMVNDSTPRQSMPTEQLVEYASELGFQPESVVLGESGYRKLNDHSFELFLDVGEIGLSYQPGHAHADTLSFLLYHDSLPILVDRSVTTYEKNETRQAERGTASHNTVILNGVNSSDVWGGFRVGRRAHVEILSESENMIRAKHDGYRYLRLRHDREWVLMKKMLRVTDVVYGRYESAVANFHFHPDVTIERVGEQSWIVGELKFEFDGGTNFQELEYPMAEGFNTLRLGYKLEVSFDKRLVTTISE